MTTLEEFAKANSKQPNVCKMCFHLPADVREQVESSEAKRAVKVRWLKTLGYEVSEASIRRHMENHV